MQNQASIAILRECKNKWERRCSLTPVQVEILVQMGLQVLVQPSTNRCFSDDEFLEVGAVIQEDISSASVIFGVKEVPIENLIQDKTYFFFSHTIKAQDYNMPLLDKLLEKRVRLVDFECIRESQAGQRLVAFGQYAGIAGAFDFLRGCGEFLLQKGYQSPLIYLGSAYMYEDYEAMQEALKAVSKNIEKKGLPKQESPMVFAVTGTGRVAEGILQVLECLPHVKVEPQNLKTYLEFIKNENDPKINKSIIISQFQAKDLVRLKEGDDEKAFDKAHYYKNPHLYESKFFEFLPLISFLINGIYWEPKFPRVLTSSELNQAKQQGQCRLMGVCDISADYEGSIEFTRRFTSIEEPFIVYDTASDDFYEKINQATDSCILFHSVDHLPAEMPKEASNHFGSALLPFVVQVAQSDNLRSFEEQVDELPTQIYNAIITCQGELTPNFKYISELRKINEKVKQQQISIEAASQTDLDSPVNPSGLKRNLSLVTLSLTGHLFDTKCFNQCIDICEQNNIQFRVIGWEIGNVTKDSSSVQIQMMTKTRENIDLALDQIQEVADSCGIELSHGSQEQTGMTSLNLDLMNVKSKQKADC